MISKEEVTDLSNKEAIKGCKRRLERKTKIIRTDRKGKQKKKHKLLNALHIFCSEIIATVK